VAPTRFRVWQQQQVKGCNIRRDDWEERSVENNFKCKLAVDIFQKVLGGIFIGMDFFR
jgi:hypothetical protein